MADILRIDLTNITDTLTAIFRQPMQLTDYSDAVGPLKLASSTVEEIGGQLYIIDSGDVTITDAAVPDGDVYIKLTEDGDGTATAIISATSGTWDSQKSGIYSGSSKIIGEMVKASGSYNDRTMYHRMYSPRIIGNIFAGLNIEAGGDVIAGNYFSSGLGRKPTLFVSQLNGDMDTLFDNVKHLVPNDDDEVLCNGTLSFGSIPLDVLSCVKMERTSPTNIRFYGGDVSDIPTGYPTTLDIGDGVGTTVHYSLAF